MANYKSISATEFYTMYRSLRLYFTGSYNIEKYGFRSKRFIDAFTEDKLRFAYENIAKRIPTKQEALFLIAANFIQNSNSFITNFSTDLCYNNQFKRYHNNKFNIILDFEEYIKTHDIIDKIETGELANDVTIKKDHIILFSYINKILPLVTLSKENLDTPDTVLELFYGTPTKGKKKAKTVSMFDKLSIFINIKDNEIEALRPRLLQLLEDAKNNENNFKKAIDIY